jgi:hypothetical protein
MWCVFCELSSVHPSYCSVRVRYVVYVLWTILSTPVVLLCTGEICGVCSVNYPQYTRCIALYGWDMWCMFCELSSVHPSYCSVRVRYVVYALWTILSTPVVLLCTGEICGVCSVNYPQYTRCIAPVANTESTDVVVIWFLYLIKSGNTNHLKNRRWTQVLQRGKTFLLHWWHLSCYSSCKPGDKSWIRAGPGRAYDKWNISVVICDTNIP